MMFVVTLLAVRDYLRYTNIVAHQDAYSEKHLNGKEEILDLLLHYNLAALGTFDAYTSTFEESVSLDGTMFILPICTVVLGLIWLFRR